MHKNSSCVNGNYKIENKNREKRELSKRKMETLGVKQIITYIKDIKETNENGQNN